MRAQKSGDYIQSQKENIFKSMYFIGNWTKKQTDADKWKNTEYLIGYNRPG